MRTHDLTPIADQELLEEGLIALPPQLRISLPVGLKFAHVFDISQTDGDPLPDIRPPPCSTVTPPPDWDALAGQVTAAGFVLQRGDCRPANGRPTTPSAPSPSGATSATPKPPRRC